MAAKTLTSYLTRFFEARAKSDYRTFKRFTDEAKPHVFHPSRKRWVQYRPTAHQQAYLEGALDRDITTSVFLKSRRAGGTTTHAIVALYLLLTRTDYNIAFASNAQKQSDELYYKLIRSIVRHSPELAKLEKAGVILFREDSIECTKLNNRARVVSTSSESQRGSGYDAIFVSELAHEKAGTRELVEVLMDSTVDRQGKTFIDSNVSGKLGVLWEIIEANDPKTFVYHQTWKPGDAPYAPWIDADTLKARERQKLPVDFAREFCNSWVDSADSLFSGELIESALTAAHPYDLLFGVQRDSATANLDPILAATMRERGELPAIPTPIIKDYDLVQCYGGLDRSLGARDETVWSWIFSGRRESGERDYWLMRQTVIKDASFEGVMAEYEAALELFKSIDAVAIEQYQGMDIADAIRRRGVTSVGFGNPRNVREAPSKGLIHPGAGVQSQMFTSLYDLLQSGKLKIWQGEKELIEQLRIFQHDATGSVPKFGSPNKNKWHDDRVYSLALAIYIALSRGGAATPRWKIMVGA